MDLDRHKFLGMEAIIASDAMRGLLATVERVARAQATVLIQGESGSGKELAARAIHHYSTRAQGPWVDLSCAALPEHLLESELFGFDRGAFSGADRSKPGLFEMAHQGTIFLDEIGELDIRLQAKLLRVLDGMPYFRIGGTKKVSVDVRVVAATNQDLRAAVEAGRFRADLYHRLNQFTLRVPPLRERMEDIRALAQHFLDQTGLGQSLTEAAMKSLEVQPWPGNIRELRNVVTSASLCALGNEITQLDILKQEVFRQEIPNEGQAAPGNSRQLANDLESVEQSAIRDALVNAQGHRQRAAEQLGISRRTLHRKLKRYGSEMSGAHR